MMRIFGRVLLGALVGFAFTSGFTQSAVTVTIDTNAPVNAKIPADFVGLSFGMRALLARGDGHFFSPSNSALIALFQNVGIKHLRVGGTTVEAPPTTPIPDRDDIDNLFLFARAAGVQRVIYSLRLLETNAALNYEATNVAIAKYVWDHYRSQLDCFALGNEPDLHRVFDQDYAITNFNTYIKKWRRFAGAIKAAIPEATFAGPDGSGNLGYTTNFAKHECGSGLVKMVTDHIYVGGKGRDVEPTVAIDGMLSEQWIATIERRFTHATLPVRETGCAYRLTEANDHYSGGVRNGSETFAGALWALDFLHWWAEREIVGIDFHNTQWVPNDILTPDKSTGELRINPKGYGLKAFEIGSHGAPEHISIANRSGLHLTAYAVRDGNQHFVTVINKEHGNKARAAKILINGIRATRVEVIMLQSKAGVAAQSGVTLGGKEIVGNARWDGKWVAAKVSKTGGCAIKVPAGSAAIVKIDN